MKLSIIINTLNDNEECHKTIVSIKETASLKDLEIVVVDDFSESPFTEFLNTVPINSIGELWQNLFVYRSEFRRGCGGSRHYAAEKATGDYLLFIDSHMRFLPGWYEAAEARIVGRPNTAHCAVCLGLGEEYCVTCKAPMQKKDDKKVCPTCNGTEWYPSMDINKPCAVYTGATLNIYGPDSNKPDVMQVFEGVWKDHPEDDCELPCMMGACYFVPRELFFRVGGLSALREWGLDEPYLSLKIWLAGGEIRLLKGVRIGHKFRAQSPYTMNIASLYYNKIRCLMTTMSESESMFLVGRMQRDHKFAEGMAMIMADRAAIQAEREFNRKVFVHDLKWFCDKFQHEGVRYPIT